MAILRAAGITFSDTTQLNSKFGIIPKDSTMLFFQAAAPTGWTKITTHDDKAFRVVSGLGSATGGTTSFLNAFPGTVVTIPVSVSAAATVGNHTLTLDEIPAHAHGSGTANGAFQAGPATPSRYIDRAPISYGFRAPYRQPVSNRQPTNYRQPSLYRQPTAVRQPNQIRVPAVTRVIVNYRQPNQVRVPTAIRAARNYAQPAYVRLPSTTRASRNYDQIVSIRQPNRVPARVAFNQRTPIAQPFRNPQGGNPRRQPNPNERRFAQRVVQRTQVRQQIRNSGPSGRYNAGRINLGRVTSGRVYGSTRLAQPFNARVPYNNGSVRLPNIQNIRQPAPVRQPNRVPDRVIITNRVPVVQRYLQPVRTPQVNRVPIVVRYIQNNRVTQYNRIPIEARNPQVNRIAQDNRVIIEQRVIASTRVTAPQRNIVSTRIDQRYPGVSDVRYATRVLVPGGEIRGDNTLGPDTALVGGDQAHSHTFTSNSVPFNLSTDIRVQYIDIIICSFTG